MAQVILTSFGDNKVAVIKVVREWFGMGLAEAKQLVESAPAVLKDKAHQSEADELGKLLEDAGGTVSIVDSETAQELGNGADKETRMELLRIIDGLEDRLRWTLGLTVVLTSDANLEPYMTDVISGMQNHLDEADKLVDDLNEWRAGIPAIAPQSGGKAVGADVVTPDDEPDDTGPELREGNSSRPDGDLSLGLLAIESAANTLDHRGEDMTADQCGGLARLIAREAHRLQPVVEKLKA